VCLGAERPSFASRREDRARALLRRRASFARRVAARKDALGSRSPFGPHRRGRENRMAFTFKLEHEDGTRAAVRQGEGG
jgi:hypothetical protein